MSAHTPGRSPDISPSRLVTTAEYGQWDIPVQHHHLNSQQLRVVWIETESPHHAGRARREQVVERLELLEIIRMGKVRSEVETSLLAAIWSSPRSVPHEWFQEGFREYLKSDPKRQYFDGITSSEVYFLNEVRHLPDTLSVEKMTKWQKEVYQLLFRRYCLSSMKWLAAREDERQANEIRVDADIPLPAEPAREEARLPEALKPSEEYERLIDAAIPYLRAKNANSGIIDIPNTLPTFVVGDIHARPESLLRLFETRIPEFGDRTVGELLATSAVNVVCLGDFFHTEEMGNWLLMKYGADMGLTEYGTIVRSVAQQRGISSHEAVQLLDSAEPWYEAERSRIAELREDLTYREMVRNFNTLEIILDYSVRYPNFYLCRGNHDMLLEANVGKFDDEGKRMKRFVQEYGGDSLVDKWGGFEAELGLLAMQGNTVFSHTFGTNPLDLEAIRTRDRAEQQKVVWGDHTKLPTDKLEALYETNCRNIGISPEDSVWCVGHRAVDPGLEQQLGGRLIHLNDAKDLPVGLLDGRFRRFIEL